MKATEQIKTMAFNDWLAGMGYREIAQKYKVAVRTIQSWSTKNQWSEKKKRAIEKANDSIAFRFEKKLIGGCEMYLNIAIVIARFCSEQLARDKDTISISEIATTALKGVQIFKTAIPDCNQKVGEIIAKDLDNLKKLYL